jgi:hypothetical protein
MRASTRTIQRQWQRTLDFARRFGVRRLRRNPNCVEGDCGAPANKAQLSCGRRRIFVAETEHAFRVANGGAACKICCPPCRLASADAHKPRYQERPPSSRACASRQILIFTQIASRKLDCTQYLFYFLATHRHGGQRGFYLDVFACDFLGTSKNVPGAPARARQCRPTGRRAQGIFGAERPSTRPNEVVVRAAGKTCSLT